MIHSSLNLRYFLVTGSLSLKPFRILTERSTEWCGLRLTVYALGTSHAVSLADGDRQVTEFLSCVPVTAEGLVIVQASAVHLPWELNTRVFDINYHCRITRSENCNEGRLRGVFDDENQIEVTYPIQRGLETPVTRIGWSTESARLFLETVHTYPEESRFIRSESVFELLEVVSGRTEDSQTVRPVLVAE